MRRPRLLAALAVAALMFGELGTASASAGESIVVRGEGLAVVVGGAGGIDAVRFSDGRAWELGGRSLLTDEAGEAADDCRPSSLAARIEGGGARWETSCADEAGRRATVVEELAPDGDSVAWTVRVTSHEQTYGKGIWTKLSGFSDEHERRFWTTWGASPYRGPGQPGWSDPLRPAPFANLDLEYSGFRKKEGYVPSFSVPIATIVEPDSDNGLSLVQSLDDVLLNAEIRTLRAVTSSWVGSTIG